MQASLEAEAKGKAEAVRIRKKLESDINETELALEHSNKAISDLQKHVKKMQNELRELSLAIEEEQRQSSEYREQYSIAERRANALVGELEETRTLLEQSDRSRRQAEADLSDAQERIGELSTQNGNLSLFKRKLESELQTVQASQESFCCVRILGIRLKNKEYYKKIFKTCL